MISNKSASHFINTFFKSAYGFSANLNLCNVGVLYFKKMDFGLKCKNISGGLNDCINIVIFCGCG